jgi:hypothetical protein
MACGLHRSGGDLSGTYAESGATQQQRSDLDALPLADCCRETTHQEFTLSRDSRHPRFPNSADRIERRLNRLSLLSIDFCPAALFSPA